MPPRLTSRPSPQQRQRDVVGQQLRVEVDEVPARSAPSTKTSAAERCQREAEAPRDVARQQRRSAPRRADSAALMRAPCTPRTCRAARASSATGMFSSAVIWCAAAPGSASAARRGCSGSAAGGAASCAAAVRRTAARHARSSIFGRRWITTFRKLPTHRPHDDRRRRRSTRDSVRAGLRSDIMRGSRRPRRSRIAAIASIAADATPPAVPSRPPGPA